MGEKRKTTPDGALRDPDLLSALALLEAGVDALLSLGDRGDLLAQGPQQLIAFAQELERHRSRLTAVDILVVEAAQEERLNEYTCSKTIAASLAEVLRIAPGSARARVARADQLRPRNGFSSGELEADLPVVADAVRGGTITTDQLEVIGKAMSRLRTNPSVAADASAAAERELVDQAAAFGPVDLKLIADKIDDVLLPDGSLPPERIARARRELRIGPERRDGTHDISGSLTRVAAARLHAVLSPLAAPRSSSDPMGDDRTPGQRLHDALDDAMARLLDSGTLPASGGTPATVHINVDADRFLAAVEAHLPGQPDSLAAGTTAFGERLTFSEIVQLAEQAEIIPAFMSRTDGILAYGASRRIATKNQTNALISRDLGCSFPGCDAPAEWCQRHHVVAWYRGGPTDLSNLTLLCGFHHREFERRGWTVVIANGLPVWIPPRWIDRERHPVINLRITGGVPADLDRTQIHAIAAENADRSWQAGAGPGAVPIRPGAPPGGTEPEPLDPIDGLTSLIAMHIDSPVRDEFTAELALLLDAYGADRPAERAAASATA